MQVFKTSKSISKFVSEQKQQNKSVGFVPTMGALHQGHLSLVKISNEQCDFTVVSIFVNPTQFNNADDLKNYPRTIETDLALLEGFCDAVFIPEVNEIYPEPDMRVFDFDGLDEIMEGEHRPGHFNGVAQVVSKLFDIVNPHKAFFGQKDFQQVAIIRKMSQKLNLDIDIFAAPIIRESDGLAMSSRNMLLTKEHREVAGEIRKILLASKDKINVLSIPEIKNFVTENLNKNALFEVEYFEIVAENSLQVAKRMKKNNSYVACIAVWAGKVRLIDNITYNL